MNLTHARDLSAERAAAESRSTIRHRRETARAQDLQR